MNSYFVFLKTFFWLKDHINTFFHYYFVCFFCLLPAVLPVPTLVLQQQTDVWCLLCTGSPAYPGAVFYLYLADGELPVATQHASVLSHQATFPVPVQDTLLALYQCQFSILLGRKWSNSERSLPLSVTRGADLNFNCICVGY